MNFLCNYTLFCALKLLKNIECMQSINHSLEGKECVATFIYIIYDERKTSTFLFTFFFLVIVACTVIKQKEMRPGIILEKKHTIE